MLQTVHNARIDVKAKCTGKLCIMHPMSFDDRPEYAKRLQLARENAKFPTARAAATRFGWSYHTYVQHENGTRGIGRSAGKYAKAFKVSEGWLLTGEGAGPGSHSSIDRRLDELWLDHPDIAQVLHDSIEEQINNAIKVTKAFESRGGKKP